MRRVALIPSVCVLLVAVAACPAGDDTSVDETGAEASSSGPTSSAMTVTETTSDDTTASTTVSTTASTTVSTTAMTSSQDTGDTETATTDATADTGSDACAALGCAPNEYCDWPVNSCGDDPGDVPVCTPTPVDGCPPSAGDPVCGCDGVVYVNDCGAGLVGIDVREANDCTPPDGRFACGFLFCDPLSSYCQVSTSDVGGYPNSYGCAALPEACGDAPSCECLVDEPCADFGCEESPEGGLTIVCPGG